MAALLTASDHADAARIAVETGQKLLEHRRRLDRAGVWPEAVRDEADRLAHDHIVAALAESHPDDAVLSEEGRDDRRRLDAERVWIVDPLDGTREYGEPGRTDWAVHVALVIDGRPVAGAVALPALGTVLDSGTVAAPPPRPGIPKVVASRTRAPRCALWVAERLGAELVPMGSAGAKAMAVVRGEVDVYAHAGGQYEWDSAAPVAVAAAAGLHVSRIDGSPLVYNRPDPWLPDLVVCRPELADVVLGTIAERRLDWDV
jgi:3'(2'), 5'-bisphosphate nucleotidase